MAETCLKFEKECIENFEFLEVLMHRIEKELLIKFNAFLGYSTIVNANTLGTQANKTSSSFLVQNMGISFFLLSLQVSVSPARDTIN